ncbi:MAG: polyprenyl synthetase family protein [Candidatus Bipolaricaulota bacterium]
MRSEAKQIPASISCHKDLIDESVKGFLAEWDGDLSQMVKYHLGLDGDDKNPTVNGKAVRPCLALFTTEACGGEPEDTLPAAVSLELIHNFSLVHDDIQDNAELRRGKKSLRAIWGDDQAINAGDGIRELACLALTRLGSNSRPEITLQALDILCACSYRMIEGQVTDMQFEKSTSISPPEYLEMVEKKTCALLECAFQLGGLYSRLGFSEKLIQFGRHLGYLYQIRDDYLGIWGNSSKLGKSAENDLLKKKKSYPIVHAFSKAAGSHRKRLAEIYESPDRMKPDEIEEVRDILHSLNVQGDAQQIATEHWTQAREILDDIPFPDWADEEMRKFGRFLLYRER